MASIKVKFRPSTASGREGSIYYQVIHGRIVRQVKTDYRIFDTEWDKRTSAVKILPEIGENRKRYLREVAEHIDWDTRRLKAIVAQCDRQGGIYSADSIIEKFNRQTGEQSLFRFMQGIIGQLKQLGKVRTSETYTAALTSFMKFREGQDILLCEIDGNTMMLYEAWLKGKGICPNTVSFYMRILRAVYNRAVEKELTEQKHPFKHVYTGIGKTVKRAIPLKCICLKKVDSQKESIIMTPHTEFQKKYYQQVIEIHQKTGFSPRKIAKLQLVPVSVRQMYHWIAIFEAENGKGSPRRIMEAKKSKEQEELESLKSRISELEESLRVERLRNRLNEKIIDIAEARWHIEIRKKAGTKR